MLKKKKEAIKLVLIPSKRIWVKDTQSAHTIDELNKSDVGRKHTKKISEFASFIEDDFYGRRSEKVRASLCEYEKIPFRLK